MKIHIKKNGPVLLIIFSLLLINIFGCDDSKPQIQESPKVQTDEIEKSKKEINQLQGKNKELLAQNEELVDELRKFNNQKKELIKRIESLIEGYDTGLWRTEDTDIYPVFKKPLKSADVQTVISALNNEFMKSDLPKILFQKKKNNIVFIGIDDAEQLTQRMGSSGALSYMAEVTYSITSVKGVNCVSFEFEEGDHAVPGQYCRYSFEPQTLL